MKDLTHDRMEQIEGGDFFSALVCGAAIGATLTGGGALAFVVAVGSCGSVIAD